MEKKLVFIDTSIFMSCFTEKLVEERGFDVLNKILAKMDGGEITLILPENIKAETLHKLECELNRVKDRVSKQLDVAANEAAKQEKEGKLLENSLKRARQIATEEVQDKYKNTKEVIEKIFGHKETKLISISDGVLLEGIRRSVLKRAPFTDPRMKDTENSHTKDQDCIAFEATRKFLKDNVDLKDSRFIICVDDKDFFGVDGRLRSEVKEDVASLCREAVGYKNPLSLLKEEFKERYSQSEVEEYQDVLRVSDPVGSTVVMWPNFSQRYLSARVRPLGTNNLDGAKVCSKCGALFKELDEGDPFVARGARPFSVADLYMPEGDLCQRCREEAR